MVRFTQLFPSCYNRYFPELVYKASLLILALSYGPATYGEETFLTEHDYLTDIPIVLSASRLQQNQSDAPVAITVIDNDMIEASGASNLADLRRLVPWFQVGMVNGNIFAVTSPGATFEFPRELQVLIHGISF